MFKFRGSGPQCRGGGGGRLVASIQQAGGLEIIKYRGRVQRGSSISREWWIIVHLQSTLAIMNPCMYLLLQVVKNIPQRIIPRPDPKHGPNPTRLVSVLCVLRVFHLKVKLHIKGPHNTVHVYPS